MITPIKLVKINQSRDFYVTFMYINHLNNLMTGNDFYVLFTALCRRNESVSFVFVA